MNQSKQGAAISLRPDLLFALYCAATAMYDLAQSVRDAQGAKIHQAGEQQISELLDLDDVVYPQELFGNRRYAAALEAADRYGLRIEEHFDKETMDLFDTAQRFLVAKSHPGFEPVPHLRRRFLLPPDDLAKVSLLR